MKNVVTIALAGNPNTGKSTVFNALTGAQQRIGNWAGKTVEKKEGRFTCNDCTVTLVDLPGTYSLSAYSPEEQIARDYIVTERPAAVVAVADAGNLERNLYLILQLLEIGRPLILVLNMMDVAHKRGLQIDTGKLSAQLGGLPVIPLVASQGQGLDELKQAIDRLVNR